MAVLEHDRHDRTIRTPQRASRANGPGLALAGVATLVWSGSFVASRALHDSVPPVQAAFWRWIIALVAVAPLGARETWRQRALIRRHFRFVLLAALLGITAPGGLAPVSGPAPGLSAAVRGGLLAQFPAPLGGLGCGDCGFRCPAPGFSAADRGGLLAQFPALLGG